MKNNKHEKSLSLKSVFNHCFRYFTLAILTTIVLSGCGSGGGGGGGQTGSGSSASQIAVVLAEVSSSEKGVVTASWLPASNDSAVAATLTYELHLNTPEGDFIPTDQTRKFRGKATLSAKVENLQLGERYSVKLVVEDANGQRTVGAAQSIRVSEVTAVLIPGAPVVVVSAQQVIAVDPVAGTLTLSASASVPAPGTILAGDVDGGFLLKVVSTQKQVDGSTTVTTHPAAINEVVSMLDLSSTVTLTPVPVLGADGVVGVAVSSPATSGFSMNWPQTGFTLSSAEPRNVGVVRQAGITAWPLGMLSTPLTPNFDTNATQVIGASEFMQVSGPTVAAVVGGASGEITVDIKILKDDQTFMGVPIPLTICEMKLEAVEHPDGMTDGLVQGQALEIIEQDATGAIKVARGRIRIVSTKEQISPAPYKVYLRVYADNAKNGCQHVFGWSYRDVIPIEFQVVVASTPDFPANQTKALTFQGDFTVGNTVEYTFDPRLEADVLLQGGSLQRARLAVVANANVKQTLAVTATGQATLDKTLPLFDKRTFVKVFMAGTVPIVMSGDFKVDVRIEGNVTGALNATETIRFDFPKLTYGFEYVNGQGYKAIKAYQQTFDLALKGSGDAQANLRISFLPALNVSFYNAATGRLVLDPNLYAEAGIHGEVLGEVATAGSTTGADYWLSKGQLTAAASAWVMADLHVVDYTFFQWPDSAKVADYRTWYVIPLLQETPILGLPALQATVDNSNSLPGESRAILIRGAATDVPNPLKQLLGVGPDSWITFSNWTSPNVVETIASGYSLRPGDNKGEFWLVPTKSGTYKVRLGGYSSLGGWARQVADVQFVLTDSDNDGMLDQWETKYGVSDPSADDDGDGLTNLQEFQQGRNPKISDANTPALDTDADGMPDAWELSHGFNPYRASDAATDSDNDGISNLSEYQRNTDPLFPDNLVLLNNGITAGTVNLRLNGMYLASAGVQSYVLYAAKASFDPYRLDGGFLALSGAATQGVTASTFSFSDASTCIGQQSTWYFAVRGDRGALMTATASNLITAIVNGVKDCTTSAPTGVSAAAGNGQVTISWNAVSGVTYNLYMASASGVTKNTYSALPDGMKHSGVTSPYVHTGLTNGKTYYFAVTAVNANGESSESSQVSATPQATSIKVWGTPQLIETGNTPTSSPKIAMDANGNAIAVWHQSTLNGASYSNSVYANRYTAGTGWGSETIIGGNSTQYGGSPSSNNVDPPRIAIAGDGTAIALWIQRDASSFNTSAACYANRYVPGQGWGTAQMVVPNVSSSIASIQVAADATGNAIAVCPQYVGASQSIYAARYTVGQGWGAAQQISSTGIPSTSGAYDPQIAIDGNGNAIVVWGQWDGSLHNLYTNRYIAGQGWGVAQLLQTGTVYEFSWGNGNRPNITVDSSGNAMVVWGQYNGGYRIFAKRYTVGQGWGASQIIDASVVNPSNNGAYRPQIAMDNNGNAIAVWEQALSPSGAPNVWSNRYVAGQGWGTAVLLENNAWSGAAVWPQIAMDVNGNAVAVWERVGDIWANRFIVGQGWGTAQVIETSTSAAHDPQVVIDTSGYAIAVWRQYDGVTDSIWTNRLQDSSIPQCSDGIDNDGDGKIDLADPGCSSAQDNSELNIVFGGF